MRGQWIGEYHGTDNGSFLISVDELKSSFKGSAFISSFDTKIPPIAVFFETPDKGQNFNFETNHIACVDPITNLIVPFSQIQDRYNKIKIPESVRIQGNYDDQHIIFTTVSDINTRAEFNIERKAPSIKSVINPKVLNWEGFKQSISQLSDKEYIYRGQSKPYKLRTAFNRLERYDLSRYMLEDIPSLYKHLCSMTNHIFNLNNPEETGAFYSLIQHHGYPTPLLDWTFSPFVAAFFAFRKIGKNCTQTENVRVHIFDQKKWRHDWFQTLSMSVPYPHLSIGEFPAIENKRMIPQQAISTLTNIDDIEAYIMSKESEKNTKYLYAFDINPTERNNALEDLSHMGITAASLFPGLDGTCESFRERNF